MQGLSTTELTLLLFGFVQLMTLFAVLRLFTIAQHLGKIRKLLEEQVASRL